MVSGKRMKAADRRRMVLDAAMFEFGEAGISEVTTEVIAARAGVSQAYLFRLFGTKKDLIIAAIEERSAQVGEMFRAAVAQRGDSTPLAAMAAAYLRLLTDDPNALRSQLHAWSASDPDIGAVARETYLSIWREVAQLSGEDAETVRDFMAHGMLLTVAAALDIPEAFLDCLPPALNLES